MKHALVGPVCRLGCSDGFEISAAEDGYCTLAEIGSLAVYSDQSVTCPPEMEQNGQMLESYCKMVATCVVECAEIWEPLVEDCE